ncbi:zinc-dependent metalloprotease [Psychroserpens damuponensis]|uniref:zinc-dependent metalloprotease n=1 Tax=Psychroserpens damuponensis TaxID=943936 RepID=UPI00058C1080|nr:proprotein convertase P-domain-containing protein [Psychroserpens damuponensis]
MKRKITITKFLMFALTLLMSYSSYAQQRTCATDEYMAEALKNPVYAAQYEADQQKFQAELARRANGDYSQRGSTITIPVAVHFPSGNEADRACLVALAQSQVDVLNADYTATNADVVNWAAASVFYPGLQPGAANISFCLATSNHPEGIDPDLIEGEPAVTIGYNFANGAGFPEQDANWAGYMNFLIKDIGPGLLGYSPLGGNLTNGGAVVMNLETFGTSSDCTGSNIGPQAPFNLGRTVTHELGHFYSLGHPWGNDQNVSCASDDGFADTPNTGQQTYNCPTPGSLNACSAPQKILSMNYMDYVNDACMYMFTPNQMSAVDAYVSSVIAPGIKPGVCEPAVPGFNIASSGDDTILSCPTTDNQVSFDFSYSTVMGFNETTTFTATGVPAGATATFSPANLNSDGNVTMTINNINLTAEGDYTITVTGTSTPSNVTESVDVVLENNCVETVCDDYVATGLPVVISASGSNDYTSTITITDDLPVEDVNVTVNIDHDWIRDIRVTLTSPNGTEVILTNNIGLDGAGEYLNTIFDQEASLAIEDQVSPFSGTFTPLEDLSVIYGEMSAGDWVLTVTDLFNIDGGNFNAFELELCLESPLSVDEFGFEDFAIFPNPNEGEFTIKLNSNSGNAINVDVYDIRGRNIYNNSYNNGFNFNQTVKLNNVQSGLYLVSISDGDKNITRKIVVE